MLYCRFALNRERFCKLTVDTLSVPAFSGNGTNRNNPDATAVIRGGPLPTGDYYIVDRESGGRIGGLRDFFSSRDEWFALYRNDGKLDDQTFVQSVARGNFRLHPKGPLGLSEGCVTVEHQDDFDRIRRRLLREGKHRVGQTNVMAYAILSVTRVLDPYHRSGEQEVQFA